MEQSPSCVAKFFSVSQEIPLDLCNPKVHFRIQNSPSRAPILSQLDPVLASSPSHFLKIHFNTVLLSMSRSSFHISATFCLVTPCPNTVRPLPQSAASTIWFSYQRRYVHCLQLTAEWKIPSDCILALRLPVIVRGSTGGDARLGRRQCDTDAWFGGVNDKPETLTR